MNFFDIYFSVNRGFEIDFPFLHFWISTPVFLGIIFSLIALRIRKAFISNSKKGRK